jgi:hypothetical protein
MTQGEYKIADVRGKFTQVVRDGNKLGDVAWTNGRILLSNRRIVLAGNGGKRTIPLSRVTSLEGRFDVNQVVAQVSSYVSVRFDDDVFLVAPAEADRFEMQLYETLLDQEVVLVRHPAVEGGVVQDTDWEKAQIKVDEEALNVAMANGNFFQIMLDDVGSLDVEERTVIDEKRTIVEAEHTIEGTSVQTYVSGSPRQTSFLASFLSKGQDRTASSIDLSPRENEVLMALYSGVSPFEIPDFLDMEVDEVESIFERLVELDVLEEVRKRREVALKARGRNIASEAMNEQ